MWRQKIIFALCFAFFLLWRCPLKAWLDALCLARARVLVGKLFMQLRRWHESPIAFLLREWYIGNKKFHVRVGIGPERQPVGSCRPSGSLT